MGLAVSFDESFEWDNRCNARNISKKINTVQSDYDHKKIEKFVSLTDNDVHNFLEGGKNKIRKQEPKVLEVESDNRGLEDLLQAYFGWVLEKISSVGKEIVNSWELFKLKNYAHCLFLQRVNAFFTLSLVVKARNNFSPETVDAGFFFIH